MSNTHFSDITDATKEELLVSTSMSYLGLTSSFDEPIYIQIVKLAADLYYT